MSNIIEKINYFSCGYCQNKLQTIFKNVEKKIINFPAGVFLIKHKKYGYILYDTGYSSEILKNKIKYFLYRLPNPIILKKEDEIINQLVEKGIKEENINYIILSHLHPDHIGNANKFTKAKFIITEECYNNYKQNKIKDLIFKEFLPNDFEKRVIIIKKYDKIEEIPVEVNDLFNDGSLYLCSVNGHAKGQGCLFIKERNIFLGADVCWGINLLKYTKNMKIIPKLIQNNFSEYIEGIKKLQKIEKKGIEILVSHDPKERIEKILNEKNI